jgi:hypothetical protein
MISKHYTPEEIEKKRSEMQEIELSSDIGITGVVRYVTNEEAVRELMSESPYLTKDEFARHLESERMSAINDEDRVRRLGRVEGIVERIEEDIEKLRSETHEIHSIVTNGLKDEVKRLATCNEEFKKILPLIEVGEHKPNGKKPKRIEILTAVVLIFTILNFTGLLNPLGEAFRGWIINDTPVQETQDPGQ